MTRTRWAHPLPRFLTRLIAPAAASLLAAGGLAFAAVSASGRSAQQAQFLGFAEQGVSRAQSAWRDNRQSLFIHKRNKGISWYDETLRDHERYPLATIWGAVPLFESLSAVAIADPTAANRAALMRFAQGPPGAKFAQGAEAYWDPQVRPAAGYAPYPGDRANTNTWCDDNAWWGLGFVDAFRATQIPRYLADAQRAFDFIAAACWDRARGGMWWNTSHTPSKQKSGEALAAGSLLGALLAQAYPAHATTDLQNVEKYLDWGDRNFADSSGLYWRTGQDPTPTPYIAGTTVEAKQVLCQMGHQNYCTQASALAGAAYRRFEERLNMGPQYDTNYLHWMLLYGAQRSDSRWAALALKMANKALANAVTPSTGLYLKAWDGGEPPQAVPNMLRTDAATVELFAWLAADGP